MRDVWLSGVLRVTDPRSKKSESKLAQLQDHFPFRPQKPNGQPLPSCSIHWLKMAATFEPKGKFLLKTFHFMRFFLAAHFGTVFVMHPHCMRSILVIDDDEDVRAVVVATLIKSDFSVREAKDGHVGIQMILAERPDLIICDVKMPGMDGYRMLSAIRQFPATAAIPLILMSGSGKRDRESFRRGMVSGADDFLLKPFTPSELIEAVETRWARQKDLQTEAWKMRDDELACQFSHAQSASLNSNWEAVPYIRKIVRA
jgi:CheY-like chemotaxis protein